MLITTRRLLILFGGLVVGAALISCNRGTGAGGVTPAQARDRQGRLNSKQEAIYPGTGIDTDGAP